jgi:hypothetical protein
LGSGSRRAGVHPLLAKILLTHRQVKSNLVLHIALKITPAKERA